MKFGMANPDQMPHKHAILDPKHWGEKGIQYLATTYPELIFFIIEDD